MSSTIRKQEIISYLKQQGGACTLEKLCQTLYCSRSTIRRDLMELENDGILQRHHGGVCLVANSASEHSISLRKMTNPDKKNAISGHCKKYFKDNQVLFMDASSTVSYCIPSICMHRDMTIITNGIYAAGQLHNISDFKCYLCPGLLKHNSLSITGEYALNFLDNFSADIALLSCKAIDSNGFFEGDDSQALIKRKMIQRAKLRIMLCDSSKETARGFVKSVGFDEIDILISDAPFSPKLMQQLRQTGLQFEC